MGNSIVESENLFLPKNQSMLAKKFTFLENTKMFKTTLSYKRCFADM